MDAFHTLVERLRERSGVQCDDHDVHLGRWETSDLRRAMGTAREQTPALFWPISLARPLETIAIALGCRSPEIAATEQLVRNGTLPPMIGPTLPHSG